MYGLPSVKSALEKKKKVKEIKGVRDKSDVKMARMTQDGSLLG